MVLNGAAHAPALPPRSNPTYIYFVPSNYWLHSAQPPIAVNKTGPVVINAVAISTMQVDFVPAGGSVVVKFR